MHRASDMKGEPMTNKKRTEKRTETRACVLIRQQDAVELAMKYCPDDDGTVQCGGDIRELLDELENLPPVQPEKETPKRVLWSGWKGMRDTRYKCPNCKKPVRNTDIYCHRCGQKLMFPNIDFTPYVEGQKQELIVRWDDE